MTRGSITPALLIITSAFVVVIYGMLSVLSLQLDASHRQTAQEEARNIAEAGINYYRWHLAHDPNDFQDGTGNPGPYTHDYHDPQGNITGSYTLDITPPINGSSVITIKSTARTLQYPNVQRTITAQYGKQSLTKFSFLQNSSSWYGTGITVNGEVHSNNGIRMDGINNSLVSSAQETYTCGGETGCNPPQSRPGVWGSGPNSFLWDFPIPAVDFDSISFDFANMRDSAIADGLYLAPSGSRGYHLIFNGNTFEVRRVTGTNYYNGYSADDGCQRRYQIITSETSTGTYNIVDNPIIFAEDHLWVEGLLDGRTTVTAARFPIDSNQMNIWLRGNITYAQYDNSDSMGLIAQNDIYFVRNLPNDFKVDAALMAQKGKIIRHGYLSWCGGTSQAVKNSLTINGSVISFYKSYWNFGSGPSSGFITRTITYNSDLLYNPPPYFPVTGDFEIISWREE